MWIDISTVALFSGVLPCNQKVIVMCCASFNGLVQCSVGCCSVLTHSRASFRVPLIYIFQTGNNSWFHNTPGYPSQGIQLHVIELPECFGALLYYNEIRLRRMVFNCNWMCSSFILFCRVICFRSNCYGIAVFFFSFFFLFFFFFHICVWIWQCSVVFMMYEVFIVLIVLKHFILLKWFKFTSSEIDWCVQNKQLFNPWQNSPVIFLGKIPFMGRRNTLFIYVMLVGKSHVDS